MPTYESFDSLLAAPGFSDLPQEQRLDVINGLAVEFEEEGTAGFEEIYNARTAAQLNTMGVPDEDILFLNQNAKGAFEDLDPAVQQQVMERGLFGAQRHLDQSARVREERLNTVVGFDRRTGGNRFAENVIESGDVTISPDLANFGSRRRAVMEFRGKADPDNPVIEQQAGRRSVFVDVGEDGQPDAEQVAEALRANRDFLSDESSAQLDEMLGSEDAGALRGVVGSFTSGFADAFAGAASAVDALVGVEDGVRSKVDAITSPLRFTQADPELLSPLQRTLRAGSQAGGQVSAQILTGGSLRNASKFTQIATGVGLGTAQAAGQAYKESLAEGNDLPTARKEAAVVGAASAVLEGIAGRVFGNLTESARNTLVRSLTGGSTEALTEGLQTVSELGIADAFRDTDIPNDRLGSSMSDLVQAVKDRDLDRLTKNEIYLATAGGFGAGSVVGGAAGPGPALVEDVQFAEPDAAVDPAEIQSPAPAEPVELQQQITPRPDPVRPAGVLQSRINSLKDSESVTYVRRKLQDRLIDLKQQYDRRGNTPDSQDAYLQAQLYHGRVGDRLTRFQGEVVDPLVREMEERGVDVADFDRYLVARHAPERNEQIAAINPEMPDGGAGITNQEAADRLQEFQRKGMIPDLEALASRVDQITQTNLDGQLADGLIDQETHDTLTNFYQHYVPLKGVPEGHPEDVTSPDGARGFDVRGQDPGQRALGRGDGNEAKDVFAQTVADSIGAITRGEKAKIGRALWDLTQADPDNGIVEEAQPTTKRELRQGEVVEVVDPNWVNADDIVATKIDGEVKYLRMSNEKVAQNLRNSGLGVNNVGLRMAGAVNRYLSMVNTQLSPEFWVTNVIRDVQQAAINLSAEDIEGIRRGLFRDLPGAGRGIWHNARGRAGSGYWEAEAKDFAEQGGQVIFFGMRDTEQVAKKIQKQLNSGRIKNGFNSLGKLIGDWNTAFENATRLAVYTNAKRAGLSKPRAAHLARGVTVDFTKKGEIGNAMNALYLFYNAGVQGTARMMSAAAKSPKVRRALGGLVALGAMQEVYNSTMAGEDDDGVSYYDKIADHIKETNMVFFIPGTDRYVKIPLPYGANAFWAAGQKAGEVGRGKSSLGEATGDLALTAWNSFNPVGGGASLLQVMSPTILDPFVQLTENQDGLGRPVMPDENPFDPVGRPQSQRFFNSVTGPSRTAAAALNEMTGGNEVRSGFLDISPETLDFFGQTLAGGIGRFGQSSTNFIGDLLNPEEGVSVNDVPFLRRLTGQVETEYATRQTYFDMKEEALRVEREIKEKQTPRNKDNDRWVRILPMVKQADKATADIRKAITDAREKGDTARERQLVEREQAIYKKVIKAFRD